MAHVDLTRDDDGPQENPSLKSENSPALSASSQSASPAPVGIASLPAKPTPVSKAPKVPTSEYDFFIVLDFEATCDDGKPAEELLVTPVSYRVCLDP